MLLELVLLNLYYAGNAIAFLIRDIFWLRVVLVFAGFSMIARGIIINNNVIIGWISLFTIINIFQVINLIIQRRDLRLEPELDEIYQSTFYDMTKREFLFFWKMGKDCIFEPQTTILNDGTKMDSLHLIVNGSVFIQKNNNIIAKLNNSSFIGEMSYLSDRPISAHAVSEGIVKTHCWAENVLTKINIRQHEIYNKFHLILSKDLISKLQRYL